MKRELEKSRREIPEWICSSENYVEPPPSLSSISPSDWRTVYLWLKTYIFPIIRPSWNSEPFPDSKARHQSYAASVANDIDTGGRPPNIISHWLVPAVEAVAEWYNCSINEACKRLKLEPIFSDRHLPEADAIRRSYYRIKRNGKVMVPLNTFSWYILACDHLIAALSFQYLTEDDRGIIVSQLEGFCLKTPHGNEGKLRVS